MEQINVIYLVKVETRLDELKINLRALYGEMGFDILENRRCEYFRQKILANSSGLRLTWIDRDLELLFDVDLCDDFSMIFFYVAEKRMFFATIAIVVSVSALFNSS